MIACIHIQKVGVFAVSSDKIKHFISYWQERFSYIFVLYYLTQATFIVDAMCCRFPDFDLLIDNNDGDSRINRGLNLP